MDYRGHRFLIDKIDQKLGSTEKEIKFDKIMISVGLVIALVSGLALCLCVEAHPVLALLCGLFLIFGLFFSYKIIKEYFNDKRRLS